MSVNYDKYKAMTPEQLQRCIDNGDVSLQYLGWLGITGAGKTLREIAKDIKK